MMRSLSICALAGVLVSASAVAPESASDIVKKSRERGALNLLDLTAVLKLTTVSKDGRTKEQVLSSAAKKIGGRNRSIARFSAPVSVAGVAVLTIEGKDGEPADIFLYLPKLRRVRRVARGQHGQPFMDTDFNYADLGGAEGSDKSVQRFADQKLDGHNVYVLSASPAADSPYSEVTLYVDKESFVPLKAEYKDRQGKPFKVYQTLKLRKHRDRILAGEALMQNLVSGSKTRLEVLEVNDSKLGDEAFSERALERG